MRSPKKPGERFYLALERSGCLLCVRPSHTRAPGTAWKQRHWLPGQHHLTRLIFLKTRRILLFPGVPLVCGWRGAPSGGPVPPAFLLQDVPQDDFSPAQKREPHVRGCRRMLDAGYPVAAAVHPNSPGQGHPDTSLQQPSRLGSSPLHG